MKITKNGHVYQLTFLPRAFPVNCYFVEEEEGLTLIDAALPYSGKSILRAAARIGKPIVRIVLTHAHDDHVGSLDSLKEALTEVPVLISRRDARLFEGDRTLDPEEPQTPIRGGVPKNIRTRPDVLLEDGDRVGSLTAVSVPGHTPGSMAFYDTRTGAVIAGDAMQIRGGIAVAGKLKPLFPFPSFGTWNMETALWSAKKLRELKPTLLAVGHGNMAERPAAAINRAIQEAEADLAKRGTPNGKR